MMCIQYFSFFLAYLTSILISRKDEIAHIMITIDLALLIIHTLNCRVYHFLAIKFPDFYRQLRIWYKGTKCINPKKCIVYPTLNTGWKPSIRSRSEERRVGKACINRCDQINTLRKKTTK